MRDVAKDYGSKVNYVFGSIARRRARVGFRHDHDAEDFWRCDVRVLQKAWKAPGTAFWRRAGCPVGAQGGLSVGPARDPLIVFRPYD
jgi:hypothetical protein